jgi:hypothetical protein
MTESRKLLDYWQPPEGAGRPIACVATSFTFEPDFFEEDCLSRFLGIESVRGESDPLAYLIEEEERLAEAGATALVDRSQNPGNRNLRWDLLTIGVRGGLMHAKVSLLAWESFVRVIVGSANLTRAGYRNQIEAVLALEAFDGSGIPQSVLDQLFGLIRSLIERAAGDQDDLGPKARALGNIDRVAAITEGFSLPALRRRGDPFVEAMLVEAGRSAFDAFRAVWRGGPARWATVISPFFDTGDGENPATRALGAELASRGSCDVRFILPADHLPAKTVVRAPKAIRGALPPRFNAVFEILAPQEGAEPRRLHAKAVLLESDGWVAVLVGSSNFTAAGLGLGSRGHLEANIAIGARRDSEVGEALGALMPETIDLDIEEVEWEQQEDEDEAPGAQLPLGFVACLIEPSKDPILIVTLDPEHLPDVWQIELPTTGERLADALSWRREGRQTSLRIALSGRHLPFWIQVRWQGLKGDEVAGLPVNVTDPTKLPPPSELRDLPVHLLLRVLGSTRPIHEALAMELNKRQERIDVHLPPELDPLRRYSSSGQLLLRAKQASAAFAGLRQRLERPVASLDCLEWRLHGPLGPMAIADGLIREAEEGVMVKGEPAFLLAELGLTLSRVDWEITGRIVGTDPVRARVRSVLRDLRRRRLHVADVHLQRYVDRAFRKATV